MHFARRHTLAMMRVAAYARSATVHIVARTRMRSRHAQYGAGGASISRPLGSRHVPSATYRRPVGSRVAVHGENVASTGGITQRPRFHAQRVPSQTHSPSIQTAPLCGRSGTISTRAGGGG